jgi:hypothetical protein
MKALCKLWDWLFGSTCCPPAGTTYSGEIKRPTRDRPWRPLQAYRHLDPPYIVVRFKPGANVPYTDGQESALGGTWKELNARYPGIRLRPMFRALSREAFEAFIRKRTGTSEVPPTPDFFSHFQVVGPAESTDFATIAKSIRTEPNVRETYVVRPGPLPGAVQPTDPERSAQAFHDAAPAGIASDEAWDHGGAGSAGANGTGVNGAGVRFVDMEKGWYLGHPDLPAIPGTLWGAITTDQYSRDHGTAVLGIVCAQNNSLGGVGIAPGVEARIVSYLDPATLQPAYETALQHALLYLRQGDVLLIETQVYPPDYPPEDPQSQMLLPLESVQIIYDTIFWMVNTLGIVVVEAGGDGTNFQAPGLDMDNWPAPKAGPQIFNRNVRDSGAIIVSAAQPTAFGPGPILPMPYAPYGNRADCFAWGQDVFSCWAGGPLRCEWDSDTTGELFTYCFGGTSSAAAIVGGAAIVLQAHERGKSGSPIGHPPLEVRRRLADVNTNTPALNAGGVKFQIGMMPDLKQQIV